MPKNNNIPVASDLVAPGNPLLKEHKHEFSALSHLDELNIRIDALESAIGQDNSGPIGRAFAIRAEASNEEESTTDSQHSFMEEKLQ